VASRRPSHVASIALAAAMAAAGAAPASAQTTDPILEPLQLPDVRDLPIVQDVPLVQSLPDVRELPVVEDVTAPAATPAPSASVAPSATVAPQPTSAPGGASGGGSAPSGEGPTSSAGSGSGPATGTRQTAPTGTTSSAEPRADGTPRRVTGVRLRVPAGADAPTPVERRERRLRRTVHRLSGCLDVLGTGSRRVLVLRAGVGKREPLSRSAVAERLDATVVQVIRSERRGVSRLRAAERAGECGEGPAPAIALGGPAWPAGDAGRTPPGAAAAAAADPGGSRRHVGEAGAEPRSGVGAEFRRSPEESPVTRVLRVGGDAQPVVLLLLLAFAAGFGAVWTSERRRGGRRRIA